MANFLSDIFDAVAGQSAAPQRTIIPTNELLQQSYGALGSQVAPGLLAFNQALAPGLTDVQLGVTNQLDPSILGNLRGANQSILDQLNLGSSMSPELQAEITRGLLATNAATGFGASAGGTGNVLYQTALDKQNLRRQRQQDALGAGVTGLGLSNRLYNPATYTGMGADIAQNIGADIRGVQAAQDELANIQEDTRRRNFSNLLNTGGKIAGTIFGAATGIPGASQIGGNIGGSFFQGGGVAGYGQQQAPGGFTSILSGIGGIGGPQYGIGSRNYLLGGGGEAFPVVRAQGVNLGSGF